MRVAASLPKLASIFFLLTASRVQAQAAPDAIPGAATTVAASCEHPFGLREGQNMEYQLLDAKGKLTGTWRYRVLGISTDTLGKKKNRVATTSVRIKSGLYDLSNHVKQQQDLTYFCRRDTTFTDGLCEINYAALESFRERRKAYQGTPVAWPNQPKAATALPNGGVLIQVSSPSVAIAQVTAMVKQRKILAGPVPVTVPAGTFNCYQVESQREYATAARADMVMRSGGRAVDFYDPTAGIIKTEYYDKAGKLVQSKVLAKR